jgi:hypothetical protein
VFLSTTDDVVYWYLLCVDESTILSGLVTLTKTDSSDTGNDGLLGYQSSTMCLHLVVGIGWREFREEKWEQVVR